MVLRAFAQLLDAVRVEFLRFIVLDTLCVEFLGL